MAWCERCKGTGLDPKDSTSACGRCGGRGHYDKRIFRKPKEA